MKCIYEMPLWNVSMQVFEMTLKCLYDMSLWNASLKCIYSGALWHEKFLVEQTLWVPFRWENYAFLCQCFLSGSTSTTLKGVCKDEKDSRIKFQDNFNCVTQMSSFEIYISIFLLLYHDTLLLWGLPWFWYDLKGLVWKGCSDDRPDESHPFSVMARMWRRPCLPITL